jgi:acyl-CoA reductase-like NAD-dependent aldehyde dehydrogenase
VQAVAVARRSLGFPILYLGIVGAEIPMPKGAVRDAFSNNFGVMSELCACIDVLIVDSDIRAMLLRTLVRTMALAVPDRKMHTFGSAKQLAEDWMRNYQVDALAILERFYEFERAKVA